MSRRRQSAAPRRHDDYINDESAERSTSRSGIVDWFQSVFSGESSSPRDMSSDTTSRRRRHDEDYDEFDEPAPRRLRSRLGSRSGGGSRHGARRPAPGYLGMVDTRGVIEHLEPRFTPSALFLRELEYEEDDYLTMADHTLPNGKKLHVEALDDLEGMLRGRRPLDVFPIDQMYPRVMAWDEATRAALALGNPAILYSCPIRAFGLARAGVMHFAAPKEPNTFFTRTLHQGADLAWRITGDSFMAGVAKTGAAEGLAFLLDALVRVAVDCRSCGERLHANADTSADPRVNELRRAFAEVTVIRPIDGNSVPVLGAGSPTAPRRGPSAALLRGSLGSTAYWSDLRAHLDRECRVAVRYAARMTYVATGALLARFSPSAVGSIVSREAAFLGRVLDVLAVMAEQTVQWVSLAVAARVDPGSTHPALRDVGVEELFRKLPLGSAGVLSAEGEALGDRGARELMKHGGVNTVLAAAVLALDTALTTAMMKYARAHGESPGAPATACARGATRALLAVGMVLQRLLGFADAVVACLSVAAFDGGISAVDVGAYTPLRYACVLRIARPLYARHTPSDFWGAVRDASGRVDLRPERSAPPKVLANTIGPDFLKEDVRSFPASRLDTASVLGQRTRASDMLGQFQRLLMGPEATAALGEHISGRRAAGLPARPRPQSTA
ncbi:tegument protein VP13/14 [Bovine alphaherpesvirus 2]|uniref:Tegument protein UL47 n=1 Tax=Bovine alphaherpesvirus 2 TaxID=10295 RepID=A0ABX6WPK3_9ALPH|nr:tegument protein VP13/14 [Bovine alphaherpesvirus 2]QPO25180.1 tegument protein VP13/14 [Bovine alphaherpesvirus 2]